MALKSNNWKSGGADCTATLFYASGSRVITLATKGFRVGEEGEGERVEDPSGGGRCCRGGPSCVRTNDCRQGWGVALTGHEMLLSPVVRYIDGFLYGLLSLVATLQKAESPLDHQQASRSTLAD